MTLSAAELQQQVEALGPWFHNLHLSTEAGEIVQTRPDSPFGDFPKFKWDEIAGSLPEDLSGKTALDIGCNAGFYSIELARRGAEVTAIDLDPHYLKQARFAIDACNLGEKISLHQMQVYDLARRDWQFDVVIFMGVFYHLRYPLLGLDAVRTTLKSNGRMVFQTLTMPGDEVEIETAGLTFEERNRLTANGWPKMAFFEHGFNEDPTNWWAANHAGCEAMLRSCGLKVVSRPGHEIYVAEPDGTHGSGVQHLRDAEFRAALGL